MQSTQQQEVFEECSKKWLAKNDMPSEAKETPQKSYKAESKMDPQGGAGGRPVTTQDTKVSNIILAKWLDPSPTVEEPMGVLVLQDMDAVGR